MKTLFSFLALLIGTAQAAPQLVVPEYPPIPEVNMLTNGTFEAGKAGWTASSGSTFTLETGSPLFGKASAKFVPTAGSQTVTSAQYTVPVGLQSANCSASIRYKTAEATNAFTFRVIDGSLSVIATTALGLGVSVVTSSQLAFPCPSSGTLAIQIVSSGSAAALYWDHSSLGNLSFTDQSISADTINWLVDLTQDGANPALSTSSVASYTDISDASLTAHTNTGSASVQVPCSSTNPSTGLTCGAGNPEVGVVFNLPVAQTVNACVSFSLAVGLGASTVLDQTFDLTETANNSQTILQQASAPTTVQEQPGATVNSTSRPVRVCGNFVFSSAGQKTVRLKYRSTISGTAPSQNLLLGDGTDDRRIHWVVRPLTQNVPAPIFTSSVGSSSSGAERVQRAQVDTSGIVTNSSGTWLSSPCTVSGTSIRTCSFSVGAFSATPVCVAAIDGSGFSAQIGVDVSSSQVVVKTYNTGSATAFAFPFHLICMGPK